MSIIPRRGFTLVEMLVATAVGMMVVQVAFTEWSHDDHLRHPAYLGQRDDRPAAAVGREPDPPTAPPPRRR